MASITDEFPEGYETNFTWQGNGADVADLPVHRLLHGKRVQDISAWKLTEEELAEVNRTGIIYLSTYGLISPVCVHTALALPYFAEQAAAANRAEPVPLEHAVNVTEPIKVFISTINGKVFARYTDKAIPRTPHRVGWAVQTTSGEWVEVDE